MIALPKDEDRCEINRNFGLKADASELLWRRVASLVDEITHHGVTLSTMAQGRNRKERLLYIRRFSALLGRLEAHLRDRDPNTDTLLRRHLGETLGELLAHSGFEQLIKTSPGYQVSSRFPSARHDLSRDDGTYRAYEEDMLPRRLNLGREMAPVLLIALARTLNEPLVGLLNIERQNKGGAPGKLYRNYVIQELALIYPSVCGQMPTSTPGGSFVTLCDLVLDGIGLETDGVEKAAARILSRQAAH